MKMTDILRAEKAIGKGRARAVDNFKKKWIPFILEFAQANLKKVNEGKFSYYQKAIIFLASESAKEFDEDSFEYSWRSGRYKSTEINLEKIQSGFKWIKKYMGRKDKTDAVEYMLHHVITMSLLYIDRDFGKDNFVIKHHLYSAEQDQSLLIMNQVVFFFMRLLDGLPISSIRKCVGCDHYFLHTSKRERAFCTPTCAGRSIQREKRENLRKNHPRKYKVFLKKQKEIMRHRRART